MAAKQQKQDFARIAPADVSLSHGKPADEQPAATRTGVASRWVALGVILLVIAAIVILVLPGWIANRQPVGDEAIAPGAAGQGGAVSTPATPRQQAVSPWSQAQQAQQRRDSQEILAQMLEKNEALQEHAVELWAAEEYRQAMALADSGDAAYRTHDFRQAVDFYRQALAAFQSLLDRAAPMYEESMQKGAAALLENRAAEAAQAFTLALAIMPGDAAAGKGLERAGNLDEVVALINEGDRFRTRGQLPEARKSFEQALALDGEATVARQKLAEIDRLLQDRTFNLAMSNGYEALENGRLKKAEQSFAQARKLKPDNAAARTALQDTRNRIAGVRIKSLIAAAEKLESEEKWRDAIDKYDAALSLDQNLLSAQQGKRRSVFRADLDKKLKNTIANPARLANAAVYAEALNLQKQAENISDPGPGLREQISSLSTLLREARIPVRVHIVSDGKTNVAIYRKSVLGRFMDMEISLIPGAYVAVGTRKGYRDVRVEFEVTPGNQVTRIVVQCEEPIGG